MPDAIDLSKDPTIVEMQKMIRGMAAMVQQQSSTITALKAKLDEKPVGKAKEEDEEDEEVDLDNMKPGDFQKMLLKQVGSMLDEKLKGVTDRVDGTRQELNRFRLGADAEKLMAKHKDFGDWNEEMGALAKVHPSLGLQDLYRLARSGDEKKAAELDAKYAPKDEKGPEDKGLRLFGGFRPSSKTGDGGTGEDGKKEKVTVDEALNKAWDDAVSEFPQLKQMGEEAVD